MHVQFDIKRAASNDANFLSMLWRNRPFSSRIGFVSIGLDWSDMHREKKSDGLGTDNVCDVVSSCACVSMCSCMYVHHTMHVTAQERGLLRKANSLSARDE